MVMNKKLISILAIVVTISGFAQNYNEQFQEICQQGKLSESKDFLDAWEKAEPDNPEMYIGLFNYYLAECKSRFGNPNFLDGYIIDVENDSISLNKLLKVRTESDSLFQVAQDYLDEGISKNLDRLDMYIGRSNTLNERQYHIEFVASVETMIKRHKENKGEWLWANNETFNKTEDEFVNIIQGYINSLFNSVNADMKDVENLSKLLIEIYPDNYILLSNMGICKLEENKYEEAISFFWKKD